jgi:hypothetical protein
MSFRITWLYFRARRRAAAERHPSAQATSASVPGLFMAWDGVATPGEVGRPGDLPLPVGQQLRRWGALLALAGLALPGVSAGRVARQQPPEVALVEASRTDHASGPGAWGELPSGIAWDDTAPANAAPWAAGMVEADGKPLPTAPPPGPVPVDGIPAPAVAAAPGSSAGAPPGAWVESNWRRNAVSEAGAVGVMQLMPVTVEYVSKKLLGLRTNLDPRNATSNVRMGTRYLRHLLSQFRGNTRQALIAYNQGLTSLQQNGSYSVAERYADRVLALRPQFRSA